MLQLVIIAPGKQKVDFSCEASATFGDVKEHIQKVLGVPPDKQRLLCSGKERKTPSETLASAGVNSKSKIMLMLAPGYEMPSAPAKEPQVELHQTPPEEPSAAAPVDLEGKLPSGEGDGGEKVGTVLVRQGQNRYRVQVPQGLAVATFGELADYLVAEMLPRGIPSSELRFICRGKTADRKDVLCASGGQDLSVMLMFKENFHIAADGAAWLRDQTVELSRAEGEIDKLGKRIEANFSDAETSIRLAEVGGVIETLRQSVESVRVSEAKLPEMEEFRTRVNAAFEKLEKLRKGVRL